MYKVGQLVDLVGFAGAKSRGKIIRVNPVNRAEIIYYVQTGFSSVEQASEKDITLVEAPAEKKKGRPKKPEDLTKAEDAIVDTSK